MNTKAGRPYVVAVLPDESEFTLIKGEFYRVIDSLTTLEQRGLARALYVSIDGIRTNYKTRKYFPGYDVAQRVIEWNKNGRPMTTRKVEESYFNI